MVSMRVSAAGRRRAFTLVEVLIVFFLASLVLAALYDFYYGGMLRWWVVSRKLKGEQAVRILLSRMRYELRSAVAPVVIEKEGQMISIPLRDPRRPPSDPMHFYFSQYEFDPENQRIIYRKYDSKGLASSPVEERPFLGGDTPIVRFFCTDTSENERILFQFYRVTVELSYYDITFKSRSRSSSGGREDEAKTITVTTTVYPRRVNMELRIEVPQEE